jgi:hypothetical protein
MKITHAALNFHPIFGFFKSYFWGNFRIGLTRGMLAKIKHLGENPHRIYRFQRALD